MGSWVCVHLRDDQAIRKPIGRQFHHGMQVERGEWYDARIDIWQTNT